MSEKQSEKSLFPILPLHPSVTERLFYKKKSWEKIFDPNAEELDGKHTQPSLGSSVAHILEFLSPMFNAKLALDLGTSLGYSSYVLAKIVGPEGRVLSIERDESLAKIARDNFKKTGIDNRVALLTGEATEIINDLKGPFDLILLDIDKNEYLDILKSALSLLAPGGHIITDDVGFLSREFPAELKAYNTHMARYIQAILKVPDLTHMYVPLGDGILISRKMADINQNQLALFTPKKVKKKVEKPKKTEESASDMISKKSALGSEIKKAPEVAETRKISVKNIVTEEKQEIDLSSPGIKETESDSVLGPVDSFDRETMRKRNLAADKQLKTTGRAPRNLAQSLGKPPKK